MKKWLKVFFNRRSYKAAVKEAKRRRAIDYKKYLVIYNAGEFVAVSKQHLKTLHKKGSFRKGVNMHTIEKMAVYSTH